MENYSRARHNNISDDDDDQLELPPGFRFHPTDEELITHYLCKKVVDNKFVAIAIGDVDMNKVEPWELPWRAKMGEYEWYFFCVRDKKYPTGMRANRATASGYWKATGKDKDIFRGKSLVGMKKTLVFYKGRAPKGHKTNWVSHEYRLEGKSTLHNLPKTFKNEWVICRVFHKTAGGKKIPIRSLGIGQSSSLGNEMVPPLMDTSAAFSGTTRSTSVVMPESGSHVHCFSNSINAPPQNSLQEDMFKFNTSPFMGVSNSSEDIFQRGSFTNALTTWGGQGQVLSPFQVQPTCQFSKAYTMQDHGILRALFENCGQKNMIQSFKTEERYSASQETELSTDINNTEISSVVSNLDMGKNSLDCLWNC